MITVSQAVEKVIRVKPFLVEALCDGILNVSSLARQIQPAVEKLVEKNVKQGAIVMSLNRLAPQLDYSLNKNLQKMMESLGDIIVRSNLTDYTFKNSNTIFQSHTRVMQEISNQQDVFYTLVRGVFESNLVVSSTYEDLVEKHFSEEECIWRKDELSAITLKLPASNIQITGFYYQILKTIAYEGINIKEVISTTNEFTIIVNDQDVDRGFTILKNLKQSNKLDK
ncbi:aspartate kinase [Marinilabiliaceae bacterium JC017]|nr:aspartate kinase [Marinilabiliaceae bacterium JC017]